VAQSLLPRRTMSSEIASGDRPGSQDAQGAPRFHVLLADDSSFGQKVGKRFLEKLGCSVDVVDNGEAAVARASEQHYDVIFMDCQMPGMDGYEASRRIRLVPGLTHLPIVALSAEATPEARQRCLDAGATDFVSKPYRPEVLDTALQRLPKATPPASSTAPTSAAQTFLPDEVWERFGGDVDLVEEILTLIERDLPDYLAKLRRAADDGDWQLAARLAHTIKGTVGEVAAVHMPGLAVSIEEAALASDCAAVSKFLPLVEAAAPELLGALHTWRAQVLAGGGDAETEH
jgi:two-component system sensor histidine kinase/response regulator